MNLNQLILACKDNNRQAQHELYMRYKNVLYNLSLKYCRNVKEAEDNLHDSFLDILKNIQKFKASGSFEGWMKRITINNAITRYKTTAFNTDFSIDEVGCETTVEIESQIIKNISLQDILNLIQSLPDQYRLIFNLYELDGFSHKEISVLLGISEGTSKSNLHRAKKILKFKAEALIVKKQKLKNYG